MPLEPFSIEWAQAWANQLNANPAYKTAAATWEGDIVLAMAADAKYPSLGERAVHLDLWHGACRSARLATPADLEHAKYVIRAEASVWEGVLRGSGAPMMAFLTGKLKLTKGELSSLLPYASAAKELLLSATLIETTFPKKA